MCQNERGLEGVSNTHGRVEGWEWGTWREAFVGGEFHCGVPGQRPPGLWADGYLWEVRPSQRLCPCPQAPCRIPRSEIVGVANDVVRQAHRTKKPNAAPQSGTALGRARRVRRALCYA